MAPRARLRVLLIDDHDDTREMYVSYLASVGMEVKATPEGAAGVALAIDWQPQVVVTDWSMPGMTGDEAARRIKAEAKTRHIPVVILTAFGIHRRAELEAAGADAVCSKPCRPDDLAKIILGLAPPAPAAKRPKRRAKRIPGPRRAVSWGGRRSSVAANKKHVLVVEDEATTRKLEAFVLEHDGYSVSEARDGVDALDQLAHRRADLVLLDLRMPALDGWGVLEHVARMADPPAVIIVSGASDIVPPPHLNPHVGRIVAKPFIPADLLLACREVLDAH